MGTRMTFSISLSRVTTAKGYLSQSDFVVASHSTTTYHKKTQDVSIRVRVSLCGSTCTLSQLTSGQRRHISEV